jgi:hypothetical protein
MDEIDVSASEKDARTELSSSMKPKSTTSKIAFSLSRPTKALRMSDGNMICLFCDRCGKSFYTNSHRSLLCGICLRAIRS